MMPSAVNKPLTERRPDSLRRPSRSCAVTWISGALAFALVWCQHRWQVLHPHYLPFVILIILMMVAAALTLSSGLWRVIRGPYRLAALAWMALALIPLGLGSFVGLYATTQWRDRWVPNNLPMNLAKVMGVTLMRLEASIEYPNRMETDRLVMFYKRLDKPQQDAEAMDLHLARMEAMLGGRLRAKVFWVRGPLPWLGLSGLSTHGIALGSETSPNDWQSYVGLDRHELGHAAVDEFRSPGADPPYFMHEGWAQSQSGATSSELARDALELRSANPEMSLRDLLGTSWYHRDLGPVYSFGGAFVDFLIRNHGMKKFLRIYNECRPESCEVVFREVFGMDIDALEAEFWKDARQQAPGPSKR
ncbi:MAG: hypothetical protein ACHRXM_27560 [Isosphaerales bacterium]